MSDPTTPDRDLGSFEGHPIGATAMSILKASAAVNQSLGTDPAVYHHGDRAVVVLEGPVIDVRHPLIHDTPMVRRIHTMTAELAVPIDRDLVADMLDAQRARNDQRVAQEKLARKRSDDEANGTPELPGLDDDLDDDATAADDEDVAGRPVAVVGDPTADELRLLAASAKTVRETIVATRGDQVDQLRRLLSIERQGANRKTVVVTIVRRLDEIEADRQAFTKER